jgi:esterase/lipase superfamily enzyme/tetratricopeptide (TPR) repeat protein
MLRIFMIAAALAAALVLCLLALAQQRGRRREIPAAQWLSRGTALILLLTFSVAIGSTTVRAQQGVDDPDALEVQVQQLDKAKKYAEALAVQRKLAAEIEKAESASAGGPKEKTVSAQVSVAWYALLARDFEQALAASDRAHALAADNLDVESKRAHALLFLGSESEARTIYLRHKGKPMSWTSDQTWEDAIAEDFNTLRAAGIVHRAFTEIVTGLGGRSAKDLDELRSLENRMFELRQTGNSTDGISIAEKYIALTRDGYGEERPKFATSIAWLAFFYEKLGRYAEAEPLMKRALAITENAFGPEHGVVRNRLVALAELCQDQQRYAEVESLYKRALAIDEKAAGLDDWTLTTDLGNLASLYRDQGRYADAEPLYKRALAINEKAFGPDDRVVGQDLVKLAGLYVSEGRYVEAEPLFLRALAIDEKTLGPEHPDLGVCLQCIASLYDYQGRYADAEPLIKRALAIHEKALGPDNATVARDLAILANLYKDQGRYNEADALYQRALAIDEKALDPDVGTVLNNLAMLYSVQGRYADAEPLMKRALAIHEKAHGPNHPDVATDLNNLAEVYQGQGRYAEAEPLYKRGLTIAEKTLAPDHPDLAMIRSNLGGFYKSQGRLSEAEPLLKSAQQIDEKVFGRTDPKVENDLAQLGDLYRLEGKCGQSEQLFSLARSIGSTAIREVPVLFSTDRKRDASQPSVTFGGEREEKLSFGIAIVTVPAPLTKAATTSGGGSDNKNGGGQVTEARRLAMHCIQVVGDKQIVEAAVHQIDVAKTYPAQALIFVHGYNVSFENAARRAAQIAYDIKFDGATFLFSWPSRESLLGYLNDRDTVDIAADHLRDFLVKIVAETKIRKIHFVAHSMGNMVLLIALEKIAKEDPKLLALIGEIIEAAPDVDQGVYAHMLDTIASEREHKFTLYAARSDWALRLSGWLRGVARAGYINKDQPLIVSGVDTIDITNAGTRLFDLNHDLYASSPILIADMRRILENSEWPPDKRTKEFEPVASKAGTYWRLLPPQVHAANQ